ncbi:MAG TPA: hypothetical protein VGQ99_23045 [Tepidisphaeraceae bacterium]|jgi:hypothetical protein|nr:hypothetical protein [Tepidisphaeraceae bacterium]
MRFLLPLLIISLLATTAQAQNRRSRDRSSDRDRPPSSASPSASPAADDNADPSTFDHYKLLSDHNIFMKNRRPTSRPTRDSRPDRPPPRPETAFILTGCTIQDDDKYVAYVENAQTGITLKVSPGDSIATGKVSAIGFDFLEYEAGGQKTRIEIGHNFTGSVASLSTYAPSSGPTTGPTTGPVDESNLSIEEKLRRRRLRELGQ